MNHNKLKELIFQLYDGELSGEDKNQANSHLQECSSCKREIEDWQSTSRALFPPADIKANDYFVQKVMAGLESEPKPFWPWLVPSFGFGIASVLLMLSFVSFNGDISTEDFLFSNGNNASYASADELLSAE